MFDNKSDTGQYRINFDFGATADISKWLPWQLTFRDRYLSNPVPEHEVCNAENLLLERGGIGKMSCHFMPQPHQTAFSSRFR
jgi:hypothetical protein